jgi:TonB-linked SusC/RagA family outer membrane protein
MKKSPVKFLTLNPIAIKKIIGIFLFLLSTITNAQTSKVIVAGNVYDDKGLPIPGVTISGADNSETNTDLDGRFSISVPRNSILKFAFIGYTTQTVSASNNSSLKIILEDELNSLQEVVVSGYGSQRKKDVTGAISSVKVKDMLTVPTISVAEMLRGKVAGVDVSIGSSRPGGGSEILIRGKRSLSGSNGPLYVVDGSPVSNIDDLNANDFKSVEVLKDAASQAIYGARASAGVILITTNRGYDGKLVIDFSATRSVQSLKKNFDLMSGTEWLQMLLVQQNDFRPVSEVEDFIIEAAIGDDLLYRNYKAGLETNWEKELIKPAPMSTFNFGLKGGSASTKYSSSFNYIKQDGMISNSGFDRITGRLNVDQKISNTIKIGTNASYSRSNLFGEDGITNGSSGSSNMYRKAFTYSPYASPYSANGDLSEFVTSDLKYNPLWNIREHSDKRMVSRLLINVFADWEIAKGLKYRFNGNWNSREENRESYETRLHENGRVNKGWGRLGFGSDTEWLLENILTYDKKLNDNNRFDVTLVQSANVFRNEGFSMTAENFLSDFFGANGFSNAREFNIPNRSISNRQLSSYLARARYTLYDKYIFSASIRKDGSSVFGSENQSGLFPSVSAAWVIKDESFLKDVDFVTSLKLRASYGEVGNQGIGAYQTTSFTTQSEMLFGNDPVYSIGLLPGGVMPNPFLKWETSASKNIGLDFGFFNSRLTGSIEWYDTRTKDLLIYNKLPADSGYSSQLSNLGEVQNTGLEVQLGATLVQTKDFSWTTNVTFSNNKNKILKIDGKTDANGKPLDQLNNNWFIGYPIDAYYEYKFNGIFNNLEDVRLSAQGLNSATGEPLTEAQLFSKVGSIRVSDLNGDGLITEADREIVKANPDWIASFNTTFNYKGFELMADFYAVQGVVKNNTFLYDFNDGGTNGGRLNGFKRDYWTPTGLGQEAPLPKILNADQFVRSMGLQDASYIRIRTLSLGYTLPSSMGLAKRNISKINLYVSATNYFTWTKYQSYGPENSPSSYPEPKTITVGLNVSL